ncbi:MAG TPA: hypothetical protein VIU12_02745, partial [Chryseolinea sp.]
LSWDVRRNIMSQETVNALFAGGGGAVLGAIIGAWITCRLTYVFQKKLLDQQLAFLKEQAVEDAKLRREIYEEGRAIFQEFRNMLNTRLGKVSSNTIPGSDS